MKNGEKKTSSKNLQTFLHQGRWNYDSGNGRFIDCETFHQMEDMTLSVKEIFKEYGKSYEDLRYKYERDYLKSNEYPKITNWQQLLDYMLGDMNQDMAKFIKNKITEKTKAKDIIELLPKEYQGIFMLRLDYDEKIKIHKEKEVKKLPEAIK